MKVRRLIPALLLVGLAYGAPPEKPAELTIQSDGSVLFEKKTVPLEQLSKTLTEAGFGKDSRVLLRCKAEASYSAAKAVLDALAVEPSRNVIFSVEEAKAGKSKTPAVSKMRVPTAAPAPIPIDTIGIGAREQGSDTEKYFFISAGDSPTLHLRNDTGKPVFVSTSAGDVTGPRPILQASYLLAGEPANDNPVALTNLLDLNFVVHELRPPPRLAYIAAPGDEFDITLSFAALSNPSEPKSKRKPLPKGNYVVFLSIFDLQSAGSSGLAMPLFTFQMKVQ